jgi:hypothetical protein
MAEGEALPSEARAAGGELLRRWLRRGRRVGLGLAWAGAITCGWDAFRTTDLLGAVLRGAAAWLAFLVIWLAGIAAMERLAPPTAHPGKKHTNPDKE